MNKLKFAATHLPHIAESLKGIAHPLRLRLLEELADGEKSVGELQTRLDAPQAIVSQQLKIMRTSGVVTCRRVKTQSFYRLRHPGLLRLLKCLHSCQKYCVNSPEPSSFTSR